MKGEKTKEAPHHLIPQYSSMEGDAGNKRKNNNKKINKSKNNKTALVICVDVREALTIQIKSVNRTEENVSKTVNALVCVCGRWGKEGDGVVAAIIFGMLGKVKNPT